MQGAVEESEEQPMALSDRLSNGAMTVKGLRHCFDRPNRRLGKSTADAAWVHMQASCKCSPPFMPECGPSRRPSLPAMREHTNLELAC